MIKKLHMLIAGLIFTGSVLAQPTYFNTNATGGANVIPFNSIPPTWTQTQKTQWCIPAGSLGSVPVGHNITKVYFQAGSTANMTYPNFTIKLKTGTSAGLTGVANGPFETGMTLVYAGVNEVVITTTGNWFSFTLQTPFLYDPTLPLFVEVDQNATTGTGPTVYQATSITGPGNGRQYGPYNGTNINAVGPSQVNFGIDVIPATPCTAPPPANSVVPATFTTCPGLSNPMMGIASSYSLGGITYQWHASTSSSVGPFSAIPGATMTTAPAPTIGVTTWFQVVATCTNAGGGSTTLTPAHFFVAGSVQDTVPYYESFEGLQISDRLPNCSWYSPALGTTARSYTSAGSMNRLPRTGSKFASFFNSPSGTTYYYTNGIWMEPGITYSAGLWYQTDFTGANNWSNLAILLGTSQSPTGLVPIASVNGAAISPVYKSLSNTFTVSSAAYYHLAIRATGGPGAAQYLSWDDLSVTIPCDAGNNTPVMALSPPTHTVCQGDAVVLTASGADKFDWSNGATGPVLTDFPLGSTTYFVKGTNTLTGCSATAVAQVQVKQSPSVQMFAVPAEVCSGKPVTLMANGANSYAWSNGGNGAVVTVTPTSSGSYSVIGTGTNNCSGARSVSVTVLPLPVVTAYGSNATICKGESFSLFAGGASSYAWISDNSSVVYAGAQITVEPKATGTYTVTGTNQKGCSNTAQVNVAVEPCTGLSSHAIQDAMIFPNPATGQFMVISPVEVSGVTVSDLSGRLMISQELNQKSGTIDTRTLPQGIYLVRISSAAGIQTARLIRE